MTTVSEQLGQQLEALPLGEMIALHDRLIARIHKRTDAEGLEPGFQADIQRRAHEIQSGTASGVDALEALEAM